MLGLFVLRKKRQQRGAIAGSDVRADARFVYGADQRVSPTAMLLTGGIVALVGLGLLSMKTDILPRVVKPFEGTMIDLPPPPPPEPVEATIEPPKPQAPVTAPVPIIPIPNPAPAIARVAEPNVPIPYTPDPGTRVEPVAPVVVPAPASPTPVLVKAMRDPRYANAFQPEYPPAMQRLEKEGRVSVKVLVGADGRVKQVQILSASDPAFAAATERQALKSWRFKPATRDGVAEEQWFTTSVLFRLDQG